jgi:hypothetical protein
MVFAVNVTFCDHQLKMADCAKTFAERTETGVSCTQDAAGVCSGTWPDRKKSEEASTDKKGVTYGKDNKDGGVAVVDSKVVFNPYTTMSHSATSVGRSMAVTSGSCFIWNSFEDTTFQGKDIATFPLSARAWCGGNGDKPTVQFYKGGNCAEDTELGGKNNKDDKGLLFDTPDTCGTKDAAADKDGPFAALGAFSCVEVVDSMNVVDSCAMKANKDKTGYAQTTVPAVYTLASGACATGPGGLGGGTALVNVGKRTMSTNSVCSSQCADTPSPITEMAKDPSGCPSPAFGAAPTDKQCTPSKAYSYFGCSDIAASGTGDDKPTDKPSTGASCTSKALTTTKAVEAGLCTQEEVDKKGEGACNLARFNPEPACRQPYCFSTILSSSCESIPLSKTAYHVKTMKDLKDSLPDRPINWMFWIIVAAVALVVIIVLVLVCKGGKKGGGGGDEAAVKPEPAAASADEEAAETAVEEAPAAEE